MRFRRKQSEVVEGSGRELAPKNLATMVSVRIPPGKMEQMRAAALGEQRSLSAFVRGAVEHALVGCPVGVPAAAATAQHGRDFSCPHFSASNVSHFRCFVCASVVVQEGK